MRRAKREKGAGSTVTIILLLIIVIILGVLFYLRSNNLIHVQGGVNTSTSKDQEVSENEEDKREPTLDVKGAVDNLQHSDR